MIRRATVADARAVSRVHAAARATWTWSSRPGPTDEATWADRLAGDRVQTSVYEHDGTVTGLVAVCVVGDDDLVGRPIGEVLALHVDPARQTAGAGTARLEAVAARRRAAGDGALVPWAHEGNAQARACYERRGFTPDRVEGDERRHRREL